MDEIISPGWWHESGFDGEIHRSFNFAVGKVLVDKVESLSETYAKQDLWNYAMAGWFYQDWQGATAHLTGLSGEERRKAERAFLSEQLPRAVGRGDRSRFSVVALA